MVFDEHLDATSRVGLERARNQSLVRSLLAHESPEKRLELAALDLFALGRVRSRDAVQERIGAVRPVEVRAAFARMRSDGAAVGIAGRFAKAAVDDVAARLCLPTPTARRGR